MLTQIITTVDVAWDSMQPNEKTKIIFKDFETIYNTEFQSANFSMNIYAVIDDTKEDYRFISRSSRDTDSATLNALVASLDITAGDYTDVSNQQIVKGLAKVIETEGIYGLTEADLILR